MPVRFPPRRLQFWTQTGPPLFKYSACSRNMAPLWAMSEMTMERQLAAWMPLAWVKLSLGSSQCPCKMMSPHGLFARTMKESSTPRIPRLNRAKRLVKPHWPPQATTASACGFRPRTCTSSSWYSPVMGFLRVTDRPEWGLYCPPMAIVPPLPRMPMVVRLWAGSAR